MKTSSLSLNQLWNHMTKEKLESNPALYNATKHRTHYANSVYEKVKTTFEEQWNNWAKQQAILDNLELIRNKMETCASETKGKNS